MEIAETFLTSEDAYLAAALLGSNDIEAVVIDESGFGGNLLGATKGSIRLEVAAADLKEAKIILAARAEDFEKEEQSRLEPQNTGKFSNAFNILVVAEALLFLVLWLLGEYLNEKPPTGTEEWLTKQVYSDRLWEFGYEVSRGFMILCILSSVLIFLRLKIGRILFTGTIIYGLISYFFFPPFILTNFGAATRELSSMLTGAVLALMWFSPISKEFKKRMSN